MQDRFAAIVDRKLGLSVIGLWSLAALLSAIQIYFRERSRGYSPAWSEVLLANALAWLPWLLIAPLALWMERRFPVSGPRSSRNLLLHLGLAAIVSAGFLLYLALFHALYLDGYDWPLGANALASEYAEKLGRYFLTGVLLYGAIHMASSTWRAYLAKRRSGDAALTAPDAPGPEPLIARSIGKVERIDPDEVSWIEGCGNYAKLHLGSRSVLLRRTLASLAAELGARRFARVHRSAIVNLARVSALRRLSHGEAILVLRDGHELKVSRTYREQLRHLEPRT
ncbi:MAG: LytTR family transcriptional regulator [bacterium]|nr:LytTR family transcriptional regulator [bacterium]